MGWWHWEGGQTREWSTSPLTADRNWGAPRASSCWRARPLHPTLHSSPPFAKYPFPGTAIFVSQRSFSGGLASFVCFWVSSVSRLSLSGVLDQAVVGLVFLGLLSWGRLACCEELKASQVETWMESLEDFTSYPDFRLLGPWDAVWLVAVNEVSLSSRSFWAWAPEELNSPSPASFLGHGGDGSPWLRESLCTLGWLVCLPIIK